MKSCYTPIQLTGLVRRGFTLIELLVIIAIILLLAALLFPVFARVRDSARRTGCQSNLKQMGLGILQYTQDYDDTMVAQRYGNATCGGQSGGAAFTGPSCGNYKWMDAIYPYVKNSQIFTCTSTRDQVNSNYVPYTSLAGSSTSQHYGTYSINMAYPTPGDKFTPPISIQFSGGSFDLRKSATIQVPSTTILVAESGTLEYGLYFDPPVGVMPVFGSIQGFQYFGNATQYVVERHSETASVLFADGHVKGLKVANVAEQNAAGVYHLFTAEDD